MGLCFAPRKKPCPPKVSSHAQDPGRALGTGLARWLSGQEQLLRLQRNNQGSVISTHTVAHSYLHLQFQGLQHCLLTSVGTRYICDVHTHIGKPPKRVK